MGSTTGAFMIRIGKYKYVHYVDYPPQLFDLETDPEETARSRRRSGAREGARGVPRAGSTRSATRPKSIARAKQRQAELLEAQRRARGGDQARRSRLYPGAGNRGGLQIRRRQ